jgi:Flp pilus assembly protein TadD
MPAWQPCACIGWTRPRAISASCSTAPTSAPAAGYLALLPLVADEASPTDVTALFTRLSARHPDVAEGHYALGSAALRADNFALALAEAQKAASLAAYWLPAKLLLARAQMANDQEEVGLATAREAAIDPQADISVHLDYAMMLAASGRDDEARAMLTPYASGKTIVPGAVRALGLLELQRGNLDAASARFEEWLATGTQSYDALYYLGVIADRRDDDDTAVRHYSRVTGGDFALVAQSRVARIKAEKSGIEAGLVHLEEFGRSRSQSGPDIVAARAALLSSMDLESRALDALNDGLEQYPDSIDLRLAACSSMSAPATSTPRSAICARCWRSGPATPRSRTRSATCWPTRRATPTRLRCSCSRRWCRHRQRGRARQHGLGAAQAGQAQRGDRLSREGAQVRRRSRDRPAPR